MIMILMIMILMIMILMIIILTFAEIQLNYWLLKLDVYVIPRRNMYEVYILSKVFR